MGWSKAEKLDSIESSFLFSLFFPFSKRADISSCLEKERGTIPNRASHGRATSPYAKLEYLCEPAR